MPALPPMIWRTSSVLVFMFSHSSTFLNVPLEYTFCVNICLCSVFNFGFYQKLGSLINVTTNSCIGIIIDLFSEYVRFDWLYYNKWRLAFASAVRDERTRVCFVSEFYGGLCLNDESENFVWNNCKWFCACNINHILVMFFQDSFDLKAYCNSLIV